MIEEEVEERPSYLPFVLLSTLYLLSAGYTNAMLFGLVPFEHFPGLLPKINIVLMAGVIIACLKLRFNAAIILTLMVEVLLLSPSIFLVFNAMATGRMNVDFFRTLVE
jgi:hypothetical protein